MRRVLGYEGDGRVRRPLYSENVPVVVRASGYEPIGGILVTGSPGEVQIHRDEQRAYRARRREATS